MKREAGFSTEKGDRDSGWIGNVASLCCLLKFGCLTCLSTTLSISMSYHVMSYGERRQGVVLVFLCLMSALLSYLRLSAKIPYVLLLRLLATVRYCNRYFYLKYIYAHYFTIIGICFLSHYFLFFQK